MSKPCRLTFFAFMLGEPGNPGDFDDNDLRNGIYYAENLILQGFVTEPHDGFDLKAYVEWCRRKLVAGWC